ncbi:hypothetical protein N7530_006235 [Penicillium desertorum]|uniref:CCHC-type domain-containing protein n=1 Tax=Penicillium desertorum TaxID=1303715 RepID=A0A9W9WRC7_9EURO|nr:hypothetical protein N7530_006235 [Penicillium desertorum]
MDPITGKKRGRVDDEDQDDYPLRYRPPPFCQHCGAKYHPGICVPRCPRCDKKHPGTCTAFCRKCAGIGHSWRHCRLFVPEHIWRQQRRGPRTVIQNVSITVPVVDPAPVVTLTSLNAAILTQLETALSGLHDKAGVPTHSRVTMNNVNITTNIIANKRAPPIAPDTSLLDRVKRVPTEPRSSIPHSRPVPTHPIHTKPAFAQPSFTSPAFSQPMYSQPVFGQTAFSHPNLSRKNDVGMTPAWPGQKQFFAHAR